MGKIGPNHGPNGSETAGFTSSEVNPQIYWKKWAEFSLARNPRIGKIALRPKNPLTKFGSISPSFDHKTEGMFLRF